MFFIHNERSINSCVNVSELVCQQLEGGTVVEVSGNTSSTVVSNNEGNGTSTAEDARYSVRQYFRQLRDQLAQQECQAMTALEAHIRERLCSIRQQQEDLSTLLSQVVSL